MDEYSKIIEVNKRIDECSMQLLALQSEIAELKKSHWSFSRDEQRLGDLIIESNKGSWLEMKHLNEQEKLFYVEEVDSFPSDSCIAFSIEEAKLLINYLNEKIKFLES